MHISIWRLDSLLDYSKVPMISNVKETMRKAEINVVTKPTVDITNYIDQILLIIFTKQL